MTRRWRDVLTAASLLLGTGLVRADVVINEVMYDSLESKDVEYVELYNNGVASVNLAGWYLLDDTDTHDRCALAGVLAPGAFLVVPGFTDKMVAKYPAATCLNPSQFDSTTAGRGFSLGNSGDQVRLFNAAGQLIDIVNYGVVAPWPTAPHGLGPSLELYHPALDNSLATSWGASAYPPEGTPCAVNSVYRVDQAPVIQNVARSIALPGATDQVAVTASLSDDHGLTAEQLWVDEGAGFAPRPLFDDGAHGDGAAADGTWGAFIAPHGAGTRVRYYVSATDTLPQTALAPAGAPADYFAYTVGYAPPDVIVNELVARNVTGAVDEAGQHEDWVELLNRGPFAIDLSGFFLTDDAAQPMRWKFPAGTSIAAGGRLLVWCDNDTGQGPLHANFKLGAGGGEVWLHDTVDHGNVRVGGTTFGLCGPDVAFGFLPEGSDAPEYIATPTPGAVNAGTLFSPIVINEFLTTSAFGGIDDWVELYNRGPASVDISGWYLSDSYKLPLKYQFPAGTVLAPGGRLSVDEVTLGFGFASEGTNEIMLTHVDTTTGQDFFDMGPQSPDISQGRFPDGSANWVFFNPPSRDLANYCTSAAAPFGAVTGLAFTSKIALRWDALAGAAAFDVAAGDVATLRATHGDFAVSLAACLENNGTDRTSWDAFVPAGGAARYYIARGTTFGCARGTWNDGTQAGSRDAGVNAAGAACP